MSLASAFDRLYSDVHQKRLEHWIVKLGVAGFLAHLFLIFLSRSVAHAPALIAAVGRNYLSAIYTPFSFILFYEVLMLIAALPQSTTQSIAKQFEIVSLIFIRRFFKGVAGMDGIGQAGQLTRDMIPVFWDVSAGLLMFLLVTVFVHVAQKPAHSREPAPDSAELKIFIGRKKTLALGLTVLLLALAAYSLCRYTIEVYRIVYLGGPARLDLNTFFYTDVFAVMIFTDVLIVILSLVVSDSYELVFRNGAFVISTILIRFSLTMGGPYGAVLALAGMVAGIFTLLIYNYHTRIRVAASQLGSTSTITSVVP